MGFGLESQLDMCDKTRGQMRGLVTYPFNLRTQEEEAGGYLYL